MAVDTNYNNVVLLLKCDGANAGTVFTDNAPTPHAVTAVGNAQTSTAQSKFGGSSALFDGTGDYLSISTTSDFGFGTGDYTVECWVNPTSATAVDVIMDFRSSGSSQLAIGLFRNTGGFLGLFLNGSYVIQSASTMSAAAWHHVALCRSNGTTKLFIDGAQVGSSYTDGNTYVATAPLKIGADQSGAAGFAGYLDDIRITKGVARYTTTFTSPTVSHPITTLDSNYSSVTFHLPGNGANAGTTFTDTKGHTITATGNVQTSTAQSKWGGSSILFDGTGDYLNMGFVSLGSNDFTLEGWFYFNALGAGNRTLFSQYTGANAARTIFDVRNAKLSIFSGANGVQSGTTTLLTGQWYHIAFVRSGTTCKGYVNGVLDVTHSTFQTPYSTNTLIGSYPGASGDEYSGYMDDIRVTDGIARYVADFSSSLPGGPFPVTGEDINFDNVTLLIPADGVDAMVATDDQAPTTHALTFVGNAKVSTTQSKWGGSSLAFDGTNDCITSPDSSDFLLPGDFTMEAWVYPSNYTAAMGIFSKRATSATFGYLSLYLDVTTGKLGLVVSTNGTSWAINALSAATIGAASNWYHIAVVRSGNNLNAYVNGSSVISATLSAAPSTTTAAFTIGATAADGSGSFNGYIDDIRITKGLARYTAAFTPPVGAHPLTAPTTTTYYPRGTIQFIDLSTTVVPSLHLYL